MILFRYRPLEIAGGKKKITEEIINRELFLATLDENNDPMDGAQDVVWDGDIILWVNLLRHYCYCFLESYLYVSVAGNDERFTQDFIFTRCAHTDSPTEAHKAIIDEIWLNFKDSGPVNELLKYLELRNEVSTVELIFLLRTIHSTAVSITIAVVKDKIGYDPNITPEILKRHFPENTLEKFRVVPDEKMSVLAQLSELSRTEMRLIANLNIGSMTVIKENFIKVTIDFPEMYVKESIKNIFHEDYLACFSERNDIDLMWSHYAKAHTGICMVFEFKEPLIELEDGERISLYKVNYSAHPPKVNYFESIAHLPIPKLNEAWMSWDGKLSRLAKIYRDDYPKFYWNNHALKVTHKFPAWSYEQEHRLAKSSWMIGRQEKEKRLVRYKEKHLKGIIFGMNTPLDAQLEILNTIDRSLSIESKADFKFYSAYYCSNEKKTKVKQLSLLRFAT